MTDELTLEQVIKYAKATDLKNFAIVNDYSDLVQIINLVLIELHSRLTINQNIIEIPLDREKLLYDLREFMPEETDMTEAELDTVVTNVLNVINPKIDELNTKFDVLQTSLDAIEAKATTLEEQATNIDTNVTTLNANLTALEARVTVLETPVVGG